MKLPITPRWSIRCSSIPGFVVDPARPGRRDCFWRIAEYEFAYGDPSQWRLLYEPNRDKIPEPGNPDWIEPGTTIEIPSINGEVRAGTWDPDSED